MPLTCYCPSRRNFVLHGSVLLSVIENSSALATEGALGRSIAGAQITPLAATVPAELGTTQLFALQR